MRVRGWLLVAVSLFILIPYLRRENWTGRLSGVVKEAEQAANARAAEVKAIKRESPHVDPGEINGAPGSDVVFVGPLAQWMRDSGMDKGEEGLSVMPYPNGRVEQGSAARSERLLQGSFPVTTYASVRITVPRRAVGTALDGTFQSFRKAGEGPGGAAIGLLLYDEKEFEEFMHGDHGTATYGLEPSEGQTIKWVLPSHYQEDKKYFLVFRNASPKSGRKFVKADFTLHFD